MDWPGAVLVCAGLFVIVYGCSRAETAGWASAVTTGCLAAAVVLAGFVVTEQRSSHPLLPLASQPLGGGEQSGGFEPRQGVIAEELIAAAKGPRRSVPSRDRRHCVRQLIPGQAPCRWLGRRPPGPRLTKTAGIRALELALLKPIRVRASVPGARERASRRSGPARRVRSRRPAAIRRQGIRAR
jgi:hypothetical protein